MKVSVTREALEKALNSNLYVKQYYASSSARTDLTLIKFPETIEVEVEDDTLCGHCGRTRYHTEAHYCFPALTDGNLTPKPPKIEEFDYSDTLREAKTLIALTHLIRDYNQRNGYTS